MTDDTLNYNVPPFVTDPPECLVTYNFSSSPPFGSGVFTFDGATGTFSFYADEDLSLADRSYIL